MSLPDIYNSNKNVEFNSKGIALCALIEALYCFYKRK